MPEVNSFDKRVLRTLRAVGRATHIYRLDGILQPSGGPQAVQEAINRLHEAGLIQRHSMLTWEVKKS